MTKGVAIWYTHEKENGKIVYFTYWFNYISKEYICVTNDQQRIEMPIHYVNISREDYDRSQLNKNKS